MTELIERRFEARIGWVRTGPSRGPDWNARPVLKASIVFPGVAHGELFSAAGTAASKIRPLHDGDPDACEVEVLLPSPLRTFLVEGVQFLVLEATTCIGVGFVTSAGDSE